MSARFLRPLTAKIILLTATSLAIVAGGFATLARKSAPLVASQPAPTRIKIRTTSKTVPLHEAQVMEASGLQATTAHPLSLAAADFDEDGTPDLIAGYENGGVGFISFSRGNVAAIYPDRNAAASALPFFAASQNTNLAAAPDFILTGDFDADGHVDVITAARGRTILSFLAGDGKGGFTEAQTMELNGSVTACEAGEINRADGLADFAVALNAPEGAQVQVFAAAAGAWKAQPQTYSLAQSATSMAFGHLTRAAYSDLAIAAGNELVLLEGGQAAATLTRKALSFRAESLVVGRFTDNSHDQLALAGRDGSLFVATHQITTKTSGRQSQRAGVRNTGK